MDRNEGDLNPSRRFNALGGKERPSQAVLVLGFLLVCGFNIVHHAMWRDEMQPWLFARDSASIPELLRNMHYETNPRLWYLILFGVSRFTRDPVAMQIANFVIIGAAIIVFVRRCPLPLCLKALTVFGFFFVYEWGTISRDYSLGVLSCFMFCAWFPKRGKGYLPLAMMLFLAMQSNVCAATIAVALAALLVFEAMTDAEVRARISHRKVDAASSALLLVVGAALVLWSVTQPPDVDPSTRLLTGGVTVGNRLMNAFSALSDGFLPLLERSQDNELSGEPLLRLIAGIVLFPLTLLFFRRTRLIYWTYLTGAVLLLLFACVKMDMALRHEGHFFLWFIICIWLACLPTESDESNGIRAFNLSSYQRSFLSFILIVQLSDAVISSVKGARIPFSASREAALYIEQNHLTGVPIVGYPDYSAMPVSGYLDEKIYYLDSERWGTFIIEDNKRHPDWTGLQVYHAVLGFAAQGHPDFLVLLRKPLLTYLKGKYYELDRILNLRKTASFYPADSGETYYLYRYTAPVGANASDHPQH